MLTNMRKSTSNPIVKFVLFGALILAFGSWGITDYLQISPTDDPAAQVGDVEISTYELYGDYQRQLSRMQITEIEPEQARLLRLADQVLQPIIDRTLFYAEAQSLGLTTADETLAEDIRNNPAFRNELGQFDRLRFEQVLAANGLNEGVYTAELRADLTRAQLLDSITGGVQAPQALTDRLFAYLGERRVAETFLVEVDADAAVGVPTDTDLQAYYDDNQAAFEAPELRAVTYLAITPQSVADQIDIAEDALRAAYEDQRALYSVPERRRVLRILLDDKEAADGAVARLRAGEDFLTVAMELSGEDESTIDLGTVARREIPDTVLADAAFTVAQDGVSDPVEGLFGWYVTTATAIEPGSTRPFEEVRDQIRTDLAQERAIDRVYELARDIEDIVTSGAGLESTAGQLELTTRSVPALSPSGEDADGAPVADLPSGRFLEIAFEQAVGEDGFLTETDDNGFFVLRVDSVTPPRLKGLDEVRADAIAGWQSEQRRSATERRAGELADKIRNGATLEAAAEEAGAEVTVSAPFTRQDGGLRAPLPAGLVSELFTLRPGEVAVSAGPGGYIVAQLKDIQSASASAEEGLRNRLEDSLVQSISSDLVAQLNQGLREKHPVTVNPEMVDLVYDGMGIHR